MILLAIQLLLAHVLGDFVLQPEAWVKDKQAKKLGSWALYKHMLVHAVVLVCVLGFNFSYWRGMVIILISHFVIDSLKLLLQKYWPKKHLLFILDQLAHLAILAWVYHLYHPLPWPMNSQSTSFLLMFGLATIVLTQVSAVVIKNLLSSWQFAELTQEESLRNAGKYIGMLERLLVFVFIVLNQWSAIGFLIAAKSILRFSDLSRAKDRKLTEYILAGTLLSFGIAIATGLLFRFGQAFL